MILREVNWKRKTEEDRYPFNIPLIKNFKGMEFNSPVTIIVGDNGTGKSTLLEAIAYSTGAVSIGLNSFEKKEFDPIKILSKNFKLTYSKKVEKGFYLPSEDFINFVRNLESLKHEMQDNLNQIEDEFLGKPQYSKDLARTPYLNSIREIENKYGGSLLGRSHGEAFLVFFQSRLVPSGLYILDEPETPLSPINQIAFMTMIREMEKKDAQFIIATHSPIIMAYPNADIYDFNYVPFSKVNYNEIDSVKFMRSFLEKPERYLKFIDD